MIVMIQKLVIINGIAIMNRMLTAYAKAVPSACNPSLHVGQAVAMLGCKNASCIKTQNAMARNRAGRNFFISEL